MAMEARKYSATRLYDVNGSPVASSAAQAVKTAKPYIEQPYHEPKKQPERQPAKKPEVKTEPLTVEQIKKRVLAVALVFLAGGALFASIWGYAQVSKSYSAVNELKSQIDETKEHINDLKLRIDQDVNIDDIIRKAESDGFALPAEDNVVVMP